MPPVMSGREEDRLFRVVFAGLFIATWLTILPRHYLPMTDLPQHAAQVAIWKDYHVAALHYSELYRFNWWTPYLLGYALARAISIFLPVVPAMRVLVALAVSATPVALYCLVKASGGDPWWSLLGFPLAFGVDFTVGMLNFLVAVPLGLVLLAVSVRYARRGERAWLFLLLSLLLFMAHALAFLVFSMAAGALIVAGSGARVGLRRLAPLMVPMVLAIAYGLVARPDAAATEAGLQLASPWFRVGNMPRYLLGATGQDALVSVFATMILALIAASLVRSWLLVPAAVLLVLYVLAPSLVFGTALVGERLAGVAPLTAVMSLKKRPASWVRPLLVVVAVGWLVVLNGRLTRFDADAEGFQQVVDRIPPGLKVAGFIPDLVRMHFPAYYQAEKGGTIGYSFARNSPALIRFKPGVDRGLSAQNVFRPERVDPSSYDYLIGYGTRRPADCLLVFQSGDWRLYRSRALPEAQSGPARLGGVRLPGR